MLFCVQFFVLTSLCLSHMFLVFMGDTNQVATKMTKEAKDKAHGEQSSQ